MHESASQKVYRFPTPLIQILPIDVLFMSAKSILNILFKITARFRNYQVFVYL